MRVAYKECAVTWLLCWISIIENSHGTHKISSVRSDSARVYAVFLHFKCLWRYTIQVFKCCPMLWDCEIAPDNILIWCFRAQSYYPSLCFLSAIQKHYIWSFRLEIKPVPLFVTAVWTKLEYRAIAHCRKLIGKWLWTSFVFRYLLLQRWYSSDGIGLE